MAKKTTKQSDDEREQEWQTDSDADTLARHSEIASDPDRHQQAMDRLQTRAKKAKSDHDSVKKLHQHVKKRLKKAFGGNNSVQDEKDREQADAQRIVNTKE
jgi:hypothetical protein